MCFNTCTGPAAIERHCKVDHFDSTARDRGEEKKDLFVEYCRYEPAGAMSASAFCDAFPKFASVKRKSAKLQQIPV